MAALVAGAWSVAYQPLPDAATTLPVGLFTASVLGCLGGLVLAGRRSPDGQDLNIVVATGLVLAGAYLVVVWLTTAAGAGARASLVVALNLFALAAVVRSCRGLRWHRWVRAAVLTVVGCSGWRRCSSTATAWPAPPRCSSCSGSGPHRTVPLSDLVADALRLAARERRDGEPVTTGGFLAALTRVDIRADWERIWLHAAASSALAFASAALAFAWAIAGSPVAVADEPSPDPHPAMNTPTTASLTGSHLQDLVYVGSTTESGRASRVPVASAVAADHKRARAHGLRPVPSRPGARRPTGRSCPDRPNGARGQPSSPRALAFLGLP